jgi:hypothetical protein
MDIKFSKLIIPTTNKARLFSFITSVFDSEVLIDHLGDEYTRIGGVDIFFNIVGKRYSYPKSFFTFVVESNDDLVDLKNKIEFSYYRDSLGKPKCVLLDKSLEFCDIDGNKWTIELEYQKPLQNTQSILDVDVRNY